MKALVAFVCGLIALSCFTNADVSHLQQSKSQYTGHRQSFPSRSQNIASNGNTNNRYWWLRNTDNNTNNKQPQQQQSPLDQTPNNSHNSVSNYVSATGCNGCASQKIRLNRQNSNTPHNTAEYIRQNSFSKNAKQSQPNNYYQKPTASISVQSSFPSFDSGRIQQQPQAACSDANSACVAQRFCNSGFIDSSYESRAVRSSVSLKNSYYFIIFVIN